MDAHLFDIDLPSLKSITSTGSMNFSSVSTIILDSISDSVVVTLSNSFESLDSIQSTSRTVDKVIHLDSQVAEGLIHDYSLKARKWKDVL